MNVTAFRRSMGAFAKDAFDVSIANVGTEKARRLGVHAQLEWLMAVETLAIFW